MIKHPHCRKLLTAVLLLFSFSALIQSQDPSYRKITDEDGLPSMTVYQMLQDSSGFIWLGTANGLCRYDGYQFKVYNNPNQKDNEILDLDLDQYNRIWYSNLARQLFYVDGDTVREVDLKIGENDIKVDDFEISGGTLWLRSELTKSLKVKLGSIAISNGINLSRPKLIPTEFKIQLTKLIKTENGIEFGIDKSIYQITNDQPTQVKEILVANSHTSVFNSLFKNDGQYYIPSPKVHADSAFFKLHNGDMDQLVNYSCQSRYHSLHFIEKSVWVLTSKGVFTTPLSDDEGELRHFFNGIYCNDLLWDKEKNIWISTEGNGIIFIPNQFVNVYNQASNSLPSDEVNRLFVDEEAQQLLVGLSGGHLSIFDKQYNQRKINLPIPERNIDIMKDSEGNYWIVMNNNIHLYNPQFKRLESKRIRATKVIIQDNSQNIWMGTSQGYSQFDDWSSIPDNLKEYNDRTYALLEDYNNKIWVGTTTGLIVYDGAFEPFVDQRQLSSFHVRSIVQSKDSSLWVGTQGNGIIRIKEGKIIENITVENGLSINSCNKLLCDQDKIWVATKEGLNLLYWKNGKIETYNKSDGLPSDEITDIAIFNDLIWVGTPKGLGRFSLNANLFNSTPPSILLSKFKILEQDTTMISDLRLNHNQNNIQLEYLGIGFRSRQGMQYKYQLKGIDKDWVYTKNRSARYPSLNPGAYSFEVKAINEDGVESTEAAVFNFEILTPWWRTLWFRLLAAFLFFTTTGSGLWLRYKKIRKREIEKQKLKDKVQELKGMALQTQMNPHFIFNCLNSILNFLATNNQEKAMMYLAKFAGLIRHIFELSEKKLIFLEEEIDFLKVYLDLENLRFGEKVTFQLNIAPVLNDQLSSLQIPPLLLQPIIENSYKHGLFHKKGKGLISIDLSIKNNAIQCIIEDDGIGRAKAKAINASKNYNSSSRGLKIVEERLNLHNSTYGGQEGTGIIIQDILDAHKNNAGTKVLMNINYLKAI